MSHAYDSLFTLEDLESSTDSLCFPRDRDTSHRDVLQGREVGDEIIDFFFVDTAHEIKELDGHLEMETAQVGPSAAESSTA